jgi:cation diffusion facilitator CzcD-associated flavoprotein CzcO
MTDILSVDAGQAVGVDQVAMEWLQRFSRELEAGNIDATADLFLPTGYWRDLLALTWDLRTLAGPAKIAEALRERLETVRLGSILLDPRSAPKLVKPDPTTAWVEAFFVFETAVALGRGVVRLMPDEAGRWLAWNVLTAVQELKGHEMRLRDRRQLGHTQGSDAEAGENWFDRRAREVEFVDCEPDVLVIGAGQGGLSVAANLRLLDVPTLIIERNERVGDNWRKRYKSLVLHDPVWADHLPFLPFPDHWPVYTPKDKLGDWFEHYANAMELNLWTSTELLDSSYDDAAGRWTVRVRRHDGEERIIHPSHVVLATGALGEPNVPRLQSVEEFGGELRHSSAHPGGSGWAGKKAVVVGACNSGHDIAQDFCEHGAEVTMVQRSSTYVMSQANGIPLLFGALYYEGGPPTDDADLLNAAFPHHVVLEFAQAQTTAIAELDSELLKGLERAGFALDLGIDGGGLMSKALTRAGGYYIDVGASALIVEGKIKVKNASIERLTRTGILLSDGSQLDADIVVLATGYANMRETARRLFSDELADRVHDVWGLDAEGELNTVWRDSGHPGFWFMGGPLVMARIYSRYLALQIKAIQEGIVTRRSAGWNTT